MPSSCLIALPQYRERLSEAGASLSTNPVTPIAAGTYPITAAQGTLAAANYSFTFLAGTLTITKTNPTITWANPTGITYGTAP